MSKYSMIICLVNSRGLIVNEFTTEIDKKTTVEEIYDFLEHNFPEYKFMVSLRKGCNYEK